MKKIVLSLSTLLLLSASSASAEEFVSGDEDLANAKETHEYDNPQDNKEHYQVRVGFATTSGTYHLEDGYGNTSIDYDINSASSFEVSLVGGRKYAEGLNYRDVLTLQFNKWSSRGADFSDTMFLGEGEVAYNINKYLSPFAGWYGGVGITDATDTSSANYDNSSQLTYDLGLFVGISGDVYKGIGYYAKYNFYSWKGFDIDDNTIGVRMSPTSLRAGVSYTF